ncbi:hypothetical protein AL532_27255 [Pseudomonas monteilii]|uniref:Uncharacterized protein n=1 Tax=Pseudomonas kurunegalensis TaxID=485880 RepID=A0ACC5UP35_9PSED|nr:MULTISPECIES: hypothetical protein [Pseudomonas]AVH39736.1 hypothetical protein AL532_27255 [Pseudomonas monteilii]MBV4516182.1 hypothetical protein [Pseudomonas kurunegalensis]
MIVRAGEVICLSSGIFESYAREGPFVASRDFDLDAFVAEAVIPCAKIWEIASLLGEIPDFLLQAGLITKLPSRNIYLGAMGEVDIREERGD